MNSIENIDAVILCGGLGSRLRPVIDDKQKVMAEFQGHPFLDLLLRHLKSQGLKRIILCTGHWADQVEEYYQKNTMGMRIEFSREEDPLGTGGALKNASGMIKSDPFFAMNGDSYCPLDYFQLLKTHQDRQSDVTLAVTEVENAKDYGGLQLESDGKINSFTEKGSAGKGFVNAGVYCMNSEALALMPEKSKISLEHDCFPQFVKNRFFGFIVEKFWDIGTPERFKEVQKMIEEIGP